MTISNEERDVIMDLITDRLDTQRIHPVAEGDLIAVYHTLSEDAEENP